ncbi:MAG: D-alanine--D-serine ligase VanG [Bacteroidales bacterium]|nr:D-alanine--D-serine ligase VanG [Lachnoclostridium sp.]MCM1384317.1 D-alanine--D-serine ligase VanG [Lachnoclostridium sp.]MCM1464898.1 D-alanine--D-serine ligase VanG [Bacteroidales bacterium]
MNLLNTKNIAVIFGGHSPEYSVSLQSAHAVIKAMDRTKYTPVLIGISHTGEWFYFDGSVEKLLDDTWCNNIDCIPAVVSPSRKSHKLLLLGEEKVKSLPIDGVFPILHGRNGEDGTVQGLFELAGIPIIGCNVLASALCMDKDRAHRLVSAAGILVPKSFAVEKHTEPKIIAAYAEKLGYPLFVKPVRTGSSYGITKVSDKEQLSSAIELAFSFDETVLMEECISGFEVGCAVMDSPITDNVNPIVGEVDEIELSEGFFDFTEKYTLKTSAIHCPARITSEAAKRIKQTARIIYKTLDCTGFARVDMFFTASGKIVFNEVNTIPGFTAHSRFPNMMKAAGISFEDMISTMIETAERHGGLS